MKHFAEALGWAAIIWALAWCTVKQTEITTEHAPVCECKETK